MREMILEELKGNFSVCKVEDYAKTGSDTVYCFTGKTEEENSLVCLTQDVPSNCTEREDGWIAFRITGILDFSLIGILSGISVCLADEKIGIFCISTYNTDYIFIKQENRRKAIDALTAAGYKIITSF